MENSDAPGVRGELGGHRASGRGHHSPEAEFCFSDVRNGNFQMSFWRFFKTSECSPG